VHLLARATVIITTIIIIVIIIPLHIKTRLTVPPPVTGCCFPGVGAGAWVGTWAGAWGAVGGDGWHTTGCLLAGEGPFMNCYKNI